MKNIEVLVSTMNKSNSNELIKKMNINTPCVIINQIPNNNILLPKELFNDKIKFISFHDKGLSKSRNLAIKNSDADICVIADDDIKYVDDYEKIISLGYEKYPDADMIAFYVDNVEESRRRKKRKEGKIGFFRSMQIQSVQLTFKRNSIVNKAIKFNENFGTGTDLFMGEENIFLSECLKKKLKIYYMPLKIATILENTSTWFSGHNEKYFYVKGAMFYEMSKTFYKLLILQFVIRKRNEYKGKYNIKKVLKLMFDGVKKVKLG